MGSDGFQERYINPYTDFGFKKLFGTEMNKDLLISFLNALLHDREAIRDITYLNPEQLGLSEADRRSVFDVYCENEQGEKFLVEMQRGEQGFFKDRSLYYATFPIREQAKRGSWNYELKAIYAIGILNFCFKGSENEPLLHEVKLVDLPTHTVFYDKLTFIYLEMPKFDKREDELETPFDKWLFVLHNLSSLMQRPRALQGRVFERLFEAAEIAKFTRRELYTYEESLKNLRDWDSSIDTAWQNGRAEGLEEGRAEGREEGLAEGERRKALETARKLKQMGMDNKVIMQAIGLSESEIEELF